MNSATGKVLGLHFGGVYRERNNAVPAADLGSDPRMHDAGVTFEAPRPGTAPPWSDWWNRSFAGESPDADPAPRGGRQATSSASVTAATVPPSGKAAAVVTASSGSVTMTIPLNITVSLGDAASIVARTAAESTAADTTETLAMPWRDEDFSHRAGYDPLFLAEGAAAPAVPAPEVADAGVLAKTRDGEARLHYQNFSIAMHAQRRLAIFTASNVTADPELKQPEGRKYTRKELSGLGKNDQEQWFTDPRIDDKFQIPDYFYTRDDGNFDKGHIVRRDDVAWGKTFDDLRRANGDTYHVTNCSPQIATFNRSGSGEDNWGDFENVVLSQAASERLCVFAGPVLDDKDDTFLGRDAPRSRIRVKIPSRFWKVVVARVEDGLAAFALMLEQNLEDMPKAPEEDAEFVVPDEFMKSVVPLKDIEAWTGLKFDATLHAVDQYHTARGPEAAERVGARRRRVRKR